MTVALAQWRNEVRRHLCRVSSTILASEGTHFSRLTHVDLEPLKPVIEGLVRLRDNQPDESDLKDVTVREYLHVMFKRFPPVKIGGLFYFVGEMDYSDRLRQIQDVIRLLAGDKSRETPQASLSDPGEGTSNPSPPSMEKLPEAAPIDFDALVAALHQKRKHTPARLVEFMKDRKEATAQEIGKPVHDDDEASDSAIWNNAKRTNDALAAMDSLLSFQFAGGRMYRVISPR